MRQGNVFTVSLCNTEGNNIQTDICDKYPRKLLCLKTFHISAKENPDWNNQDIQNINKLYVSNVCI